jgi:hypothetical protein
MQARTNVRAPATPLPAPQERLVYEQLSGLCRDASWLKSYMAAALLVSKETFQATALALGPTKQPLPSFGLERAAVKTHGAVASNEALAAEMPKVGGVGGVGGWWWAVVGGVGGRAGGVAGWWGGVGAWVGGWVGGRAAGAGAALLLHALAQVSAYWRLCWLLLAAAGCCWLLLLAAAGCCCWLLLAAGRPPDRPHAPPPTYMHAAPAAVPGDAPPARRRDDHARAGPRAQGHRAAAGAARARGRGAH